MNKNILHVYHFDKKTRLGVCQDGGYVIGVIEKDNVYDCYISAGISNEESFTRDFVNKYNIKKENSFGFDGTIDTYPYHYTNEINFIKKNINEFNDDNNTNLSFLLDTYKNIFLKMDIEAGEYPWLLNVSEEQLSNIKQIVIEFHGINDDSWGVRLQDKTKCLEKLNRTHYIIHAHGNNCGTITGSIPDTIELTYINKSYFKTEPAFNENPLPIEGLDYPNCGRNDYILSYPFVHTPVV